MRVIIYILLGGSILSRLCLLLRLSSDQTVQDLVLVSFVTPHPPKQLPLS